MNGVDRADSVSCCVEQVAAENIPPSSKMNGVLSSLISYLDELYHKEGTEAFAGGLSVSARAAGRMVKAC